MKKYMKFLAVALAAAGTTATLTGCSEEKVYELNAEALPLAADYADMVTITVDQSTNYATFSFNGKGVYPIWIIDGKTYSTSHTFSRYYRKAGEYGVEVKFGNGNGISVGTVERTFTVDNTQMSGWPGFVYDSEYNLFAKATKKEPSFFYAPGWAQIANPAWNFDGTTYTLTLPEATTDQWQAQMHVGTDICLQEGEHYDGSYIFTCSQDMSNITVKIHPDGDDDDAHSFFPATKVNVKAGEPQAFFFYDVPAAIDMNNLVYTFDFGGNPAGVEIIIENIVIKNHNDDDGTPVPDIPSTPEPNWVDVNSADNLWNGLGYNLTYFYADPSWSPYADPVLTEGNNSWSWALPQANTDQWQTQIVFHTELDLSDTSQLYDFKITLLSAKDLGGATVKLTQEDNDDTYFFAETYALTGGEPKTVWFASLQASKDPITKMKLVLDFGGTPADNEVTVSDIILQKHHD